jgi:hypothetical protein
MIQKRSAGLLEPARQGSADWREVEFRAGVTWGAAGDSHEMLLMLLGRLLDGERPSGPASMTFTGAPATYNRRVGAARDFEAQLRAGGGGTERVLILTLGAQPDRRSFTNHLLTKLLALRPGRGVDSTAYAVAALRRHNVGLLLIEGTDNLLRCRRDERDALLEMFAGISKGLGAHVVGVGESPNDCFTAVGAPVAFLNKALGGAAGRTVMECLTGS